MSSSGSLYANNLLYNTASPFKPVFMTGNLPLPNQVLTAINSNTADWTYYDGATGPTGPSGLQGPTGQQGLQGLAGFTGLNGLQGPTGEQGLKGDTGMVGENGSTGPTGSSCYCLSTPLITLNSSGNALTANYLLQNGQNSNIGFASYLLGTRTITKIDMACVSSIGNPINMGSMNTYSITMYKNSVATTNIITMPAGSSFTSLTLSYPITSTDRVSFLITKIGLPPACALLVTIF